MGYIPSDIIRSSLTPHIKALPDPASVLRGVGAMWANETTRQISTFILASFAYPLLALVRFVAQNRLAVCARWCSERLTISTVDSI